LAPAAVAAADRPRANLTARQDIPDDDFNGGAAVPTGRAARLLRFGGIASGIAGGVAMEGLRTLASGRRPDLAQLLLTPANTLRLTDGLSHLRGAALKLGQMLSMIPAWCCRKN